MPKYTYIAISFFISIILLVFGHNTWTAIGIGLTSYNVLNVIDEMGEQIPVLELMLTMACLQWILGPFFEYGATTHHYKYHMYVDENTYMSFIVPSILVFQLGISIFKFTQDSDLNEIGENVKDLLDEYPQLPYILIFGGLIIPFLSPILPGSLRFVFALLANVKYIGVIYLLFSDSPNRWPIFWGTMALTALASIAAGMFHDLLLWGMLMFTFVARELELSFIKKISIAILGIFLAMTIQSAKTQYRELVWKQGYQGNKALLFLSIATEQWSTGKIITPSSDEDMNVRLNQGWIISAVMNNVPENEPFAHGSTITEAISASLLPRFLDPNKKRAGGQENFNRFTGLHISNDTSMGISIAGEGYANYGYLGGIIFMFLWGLFVGWFWIKLNEFTDLYPTLLIWSPILFLQVVKAETEFAVVLNHLIKSSILVFGLLWFINRKWGIRI